jgi:hypothetical protein
MTIRPIIIILETMLFVIDVLLKVFSKDVKSLLFLGVNGDLSGHEYRRASATVYSTALVMESHRKSVGSSCRRTATGSLGGGPLGSLGAAHAWRIEHY